MFLIELNTSNEQQTNGRRQITSAIMKLSGVIAVIFSAVCLTAALPEDVTKYTTKYDGIDVDSILKNDRLLKNYIDCVMDRGRCTKEGAELKKYIPDAIATNCSKCSEKQKQLAGKVMAHLLQNKRGYWNEILDKYDKDGEFRKRYEYEE